MLMLSINAAKEMEMLDIGMSNQDRMTLAMKCSHKLLSLIRMPNSYGDPDFTHRQACFDLLTDFSGLFNSFHKIRKNRSLR